MSHATETREIFCLKCRKRTESTNLAPTEMKNGKKALKGKCTVCGTNTFTITKSN
jgi:hypothetical protein